MNIVNFYEDNVNIVRMYHVDRIQCDMDAVEWISDVRTLDDIHTDYIQFSKTTDEINDTLLGPNVSLENMKFVFSHGDFNSVYLNGEFKGRPIAVGVYLVNKHVSITFSKSEPADLSALELALGSIEV